MKQMAIPPPISTTAAIQVAARRRGRLADRKSP
jgi:hypothetical protein